eukprot:9475335-Pyramimonas_sp.AAC.2
MWVQSIFMRVEVFKTHVRGAEGESHMLEDTFPLPCMFGRRLQGACAWRCASNHMLVTASPPSM